MGQGAPREPKGADCPAAAADSTALAGSEEPGTVRWRLRERSRLQGLPTGPAPRTWCDVQGGDWECREGGQRGV